jgi:hypothetical protein
MSEQLTETNPTVPAGDVADLLTDEKIGPRDGRGRLAVVAMSGGTAWSA